MHYKNGREAKNGDKVVLFPEWPKDADGKSLGTPIVGILYDAQAGNDFCNGKLAPVSSNDPMPNLKECLHLDDVRAALHVVFAKPPDGQTAPPTATAEVTADQVQPIP